jgi:hypothetical protein
LHQKNLADPRDSPMALEIQRRSEPATLVSISILLTTEQMNPYLAHATKSSYGVKLPDSCFADTHKVRLICAADAALGSQPRVELEMMPRKTKIDGPTDPPASADTSSVARAEGGIRTHNPRFTKAVLCH